MTHPRFAYPAPDGIRAPVLLELNRAVPDPITPRTKPVNDPQCRLRIRRGPIFTVMATAPWLMLHTCKSDTFVTPLTDWISDHSSSTFTSGGAPSSKIFIDERMTPSVE